MKTKLLGAFLCATMLAGLFAGCGNSGNTTESIAANDSNTTTTAAAEVATEAATTEAATNVDWSLWKEAYTNYIQEFADEAGVDISTVNVALVDLGTGNMIPQLVLDTYDVNGDDTLAVCVYGTNGFQTTGIFHGADAWCGGYNQFYTDGSSEFWCECEEGDDTTPYMNIFTILNVSYADGGRISSIANVYRIEDTNLVVVPETEAQDVADNYTSLGLIDSCWPYTSDDWYAEMSAWDMMINAGYVN